MLLRGELKGSGIEKLFIDALASWCIDIENVVNERILKPFVKFRIESIHCGTMTVGFIHIIPLFDKMFFKPFFSVLFAHVTDKSLWAIIVESPHYPNLCC